MSRTRRGTKAYRLTAELTLLAALPLALAELMLVMLEAAAELVLEREVVDLDAAEVAD